MVIKSESDEEGKRAYSIIGQVFFASSDQFAQSFDFKEVLDDVTIDLSQAHFWDITSVAALDKVVIKFRREGAAVNVIGMNEATQTVVDKFGVHDKPEEVEKIMAGH
jgi:SulP family sulfate permease